MCVGSLRPMSHPMSPHSHCVPTFIDERLHRQRAVAHVEGIRGLGQDPPYSQWRLIIERPLGWVRCDGDTQGTALGPPILVFPVLTLRCWWWRRFWRGKGKVGPGGGPAAFAGSFPRGKWQSWGVPGWRLGKEG